MWGLMIKFMESEKYQKIPIDIRWTIINIIIAMLMLLTIKYWHLF